MACGILYEPDNFSYRSIEREVAQFVRFFIFRRDPKSFGGDIHCDGIESVRCGAKCSHKVQLPRNVGIRAD